MNIIEKIGLIVIAEIIEAIMIIILILVIAIMGSIDPILEKIASDVIFIMIGWWFLMGVITPFMIGFEIWNFIDIKI